VEERHRAQPAGEVVRVRSRLREAAVLYALPLCAAGARAQAVELPLRPYVAGLTTVAVGVAGDTLPFILDTGGGITLVTPRVAERAGCTPFGRTVAFRAVGERLDMPRCGPVRLSLGPLTLQGEAAYFDLARLLGGAPPVGGLVTLQTFQDRAITLDLARGRLVVETDASLAERVRGMTPLKVRLAHQAGGASVDLFLGIETPQGTVWMEVDSGNGGPVMISPPAALQLGVALDEREIRPVRLPVAGLGAVEVRAIRRDLIYDGLLNADFVRGMLLTVDLRSGRAWAKLNPVQP